MNNLTQHAACRLQQRGIKYETIEMLMVCGARRYDHQGAVILYFDKPARQRVRDQYSSVEYRKIEGQLDTYAVVSDNGSIITAGHRMKRINRH